MSYIYLMVSFNPIIRNNRIIKKTSVFMHIRKQYNIIVIFFIIKTFRRKRLLQTFRRKGVYAETFQ